ncbi:peptidase domain-containing ABC transporter [Dyadobacter sp. CY343]|uniref:peptidase domain-containing ABC transporter n=1 Tax=Dyadobacter sp. CY343 TaxID=2907299 RepID=UPI001F255730|nr:peptidase domain-containing ABC transporter [Dyadobacter sp. CY343]MCE7063213.1 peptidase domain-containing ABC transporter [Dyadobacter sp. CY343]
MPVNFQHYRQLDKMDCGPTCLRMVAKYYGRHYSAQSLRELAQIGKEGVSLLGIADAAEAIGFKTVGVKVSLDKLVKDAPLPCILHWGQNHFVVLYKITRDTFILSKQGLQNVWGGRSQEANSTTPIPNSNPAAYRSVFKKNTDYDFHVADPSSGLSSYNEKEFSKMWLSSLNKDDKEGIALLLETTPRFFEERGEKNDGVTLTQLVGYLSKYRKLLVQLFLGMLVGSGLSLLFPFLTQSIVDIGIGTQDINFIYLALIAQAVLLLSTTVVEYIRSWILLHISVRLNLTILSDFLIKLMRLPISFFDVRQFGDIMQRIGDHQRIQTFLTGQALNLLFSFFNLFVFGAVLAFYSLQIFTVALAASILYATWVVLFLKKRRQLDVKRFNISSGNQSILIQLIQSMQEIKLAGAETLKRWEWERTQAKYFKWNVSSLSLSQVQQAGALFINQGKSIIITFLAAKAVLDGNMTLGGMMSVQYILGQFNSPIEQLVSFLQSWQDAQISLERLNEVHRIEEEEPAHKNNRKEWDTSQDIQISGLSYTYPGAGNEPVLSDINLTIPHGKTTAIVGTSGSGKTTLLKLLLRFYEPQKGEIRLTSNQLTSQSPIIEGSLKQNGEWTRGIALKYISHKAWRSQCGVVMQDGFIFSDTVARNIAVSDEIIDQNRLYRAAQTANIHDFIESLPLGYHTMIGSAGNGISQGQRQRILIARAVYKNPQLLLFDEATNSLDANNEAIIVRELNKFFKGRTVIVVAHRLSTVKHADQIVVMEKGEILEVGTHKELVEKRGKYFELVSNQLELAEG